MAKFFSVANVNKLEPKVLARVRTLLDRVEEHRKEGKVVDISNAFRCFATDVISDYAAPHSRDFLRTPDFSAAFNRVLRDFSELMMWHRHIPIIFPIMNAIPRAVVAKMDPTGANLAVVDNQAVRLQSIASICPQYLLTLPRPSLIKLGLSLTAKVFLKAKNLPLCSTQSTPPPTLVHQKRRSHA